MLTELLFLAVFLMDSLSALAGVTPHVCGGRFLASVIPAHPWLLPSSDRGYGHSAKCLGSLLSFYSQFFFLKKRSNRKTHRNVSNQVSKNRTAAHAESRTRERKEASEPSAQRRCSGSPEPAKLLFRGT